MLCLVARKRSADLDQKEQTKRNKYILKNKSITILKHEHKFFNTPPIKKQGLCSFPLNLGEVVIDKTTEYNVHSTI